MQNKLSPILGDIRKLLKEIPGVKTVGHYPEYVKNIKSSKMPAIMVGVDSISYPVDEAQNMGYTVIANIRVMVYLNVTTNVEIAILDLKTSIINKLNKDLSLNQEVLLLWPTNVTIGDFSPDFDFYTPNISEQMTLFEIDFECKFCDAIIDR
ncbi:MAG: hypothetical protein DRQ46_00470 [Gammaproteobacteria bacterium]|nr:MAG: hypothetical protein DRQ46_00470 [Gammaproteobacteria bacterium]